MQTAPDLLSPSDKFRGSYSVDDILGPSRAALVGAASIGRPQVQSYNGKYLKRVIPTPGLEMAFSPHFAVAKRRWDDLVIEDLEKKRLQEQMEAAAETKGEELNHVEKGDQVPPKKENRRGNFDALRNLMNDDLVEVEESAPVWIPPSPYPYQGQAFFEGDEDDDQFDEEDEGEEEVDADEGEEEEEDEDDGKNDDYEITYSSDEDKEGESNPSSSLQALTLSDSEKDMDGAPQGPLYQATAVPMDSLTPITGEDLIDRQKEALRATCHNEEVVGKMKLLDGRHQDLDESVILAFETIVEVLYVVNDQHQTHECPWHIIFAAINLLRKMLKFHLDSMLAMLKDDTQSLQNSILTGVVAGVVRAVTNLESALAQNAVLCCGELLFAAHFRYDESSSFTPLSLVAADASLITSVLIEALVSSNPKAIRMSATDGLTMVLTDSLPLELLGCFITAAVKRSSHPNTAVSEASMYYSAIAFSLLMTHLLDLNYFNGEEHNKDDYILKNKISLSNLMNVTTVLECISLNLSSNNGKPAHRKSDARRCCVVLHNLIGQEEYTMVVHNATNLSPLQMDELIRASRKNAQQEGTNSKPSTTTSTTKGNENESHVDNKEEHEETKKNSETRVKPKLKKKDNHPHTTVRKKGGWSLFNRGKKNKQKDEDDDEEGRTTIDQPIKNSKILSKGNNDNDNFNINLNDDDEGEDEGEDNLSQMSSSNLTSKSISKNKNNPNRPSRLSVSTSSVLKKTKTSPIKRRTSHTTPTSRIGSRTSPNLRNRNNLTSSSSSSVLSSNTSSSLGKPTSIPLRNGSATRRTPPPCSSSGSSSSVSKRGAAQDRAMMLKQRRSATQSLDSVVSPSKKKTSTTATPTSSLKRESRSGSMQVSPVRSHDRRSTAPSPTTGNVTSSPSSSLGVSPIRGVRRVTSASSSSSSGGGGVSSSSSNSIRSSNPKNRPKTTAIERRPSSSRS